MTVVMVVMVVVLVEERGAERVERLWKVQTARLSLTESERLLRFKCRVGYVLPKNPKSSGSGDIIFNRSLAAWLDRRNTKAQAHSGRREPKGSVVQAERRKGTQGETFFSLGGNAVSPKFSGCMMRKKECKVSILSFKRNAATKHYWIGLQ